MGRLLLSPYGGYFREDFHVVIGFALQRFLVIGLIIGGVALVTSLGLSRVISRPVVKLTEATRAVAAGNLNVRIREQYGGEVGELASAFNQMTDELARADRLRRNLTADVAHELRTPLSVIRGKLEGVLDGVYPATPEHLGADPGGGQVTGSPGRGPAPVGDGRGGPVAWRNRGWMSATYSGTPRSFRPSGGRPWRNPGAWLAR